MPIQRCEYVDPLSLYASLSENGSNPFILETMEKDCHDRGYTYVSSDPSFLVEVRGDGTYIDGRLSSKETNPYKVLEDLTAKRECGERFTSGFVGYVAYDAVHNYIGGRIEEPSVFGHYEDVFIFDHQKKELYHRCLNGNDRPVGGLIREAKGLEVDDGQKDIFDIRQDVGQQGFMEMVERAKEYVFSGDAFQIVLSREYEFTTDTDPLGFYSNLRRINPSPYMFLMEFESKSVAGSSPETMASVDGGLVRINPIAGTSRRGKDPAEDEELARMLLSDEKERAEHAMLVDLARNDIGKVCDPCSIRIPTMMKVRSYSHVQHIESEVTGTLSRERTCYDAIESSFPAGTLSGAPKIRAMEIIDELEASRRRVYGGCVGYFSSNGCADTAIAIRMAEFDKVCRVRAGAGIVADSDPLSEFYETERKMSAVLDALGVKNDDIDTK